MLGVVTKVTGSLSFDNTFYMADRALFCSAFCCKSVTALLMVSGLAPQDTLPKLFVLYYAQARLLRE
jgi:hypothetical protein